MRKEKDCKKTEAYRNPRVVKLDESFARTADSSPSEASPLKSDRREVQFLGRSKDFRNDTAEFQQPPNKGGCRDYKCPMKRLHDGQRSVLSKRFDADKLARQIEEDLEDEQYPPPEYSISDTEDIEEEEGGVLDE